MKDGTIQKSDDDVLVYAVRGEKWRGRKSVELEVEGRGGGGREEKRARKQDHGEGSPSKGFRLHTRGFKLFSRYKKLLR